jgi:hypothetical protein
MQRQGLTIQNWHDVYSSIVPIVITEQAQMSKVMACEQKWDEVGPELDILTKGSSLATKLFATALCFVLGSGMKEVMDAALKELLDKQKFDAPMVETMKQKVLTEAEKRGCLTSLSHKRAIRCKYLGIVVEVEVHNVAEDLYLYKATPHHPTSYIIHNTSSAIVYS